MAAQKRHDTDIAEGKGSSNDLMNYGSMMRPSTTGTFFPSANMYQARLGQTAGSMRKGFSSKRIAFYNSAKSDKPKAKHLSETPGFFNVRQMRNQSTNSYSTQPGMSKSFNNYIKARERAESIAKAHIEKMNTFALKKVKNEKLAEKAAKMDKMAKAAELEKVHEKQKLIKTRKEQDNKQLDREAVDAYKENITEIKRRLNEKKQREKEQSLKIYN